MFQVELAFFAALREDPKIEFVSVPQHQAGAILVAIFLVSATITSLIDYILSVTILNLPVQYYVLFIIRLATAIILLSLLMYFGRIYFRSLDKLQHVQTTFDVRNCECGVPEDHPTLLGAIDHYLGEEEVPESGIELFNHLVKQNLRIHSPFTGPRSVLVVSYLPAFILGSILPNAQGAEISWFNLLDNWASGVPGTAVTFNFPWAVWTAYVFLVHNPFVVYTFLALLKLVWRFEKWSGLRNPFLIFALYAAFLMFDLFVPIRLWLCTLGFYYAAGSIADRWTYWFFANPFTSWPDLLTASNNEGGFGLFHYSMDHPKYLAVPVWGRVIIVIWMVVSSLGIYWLFESVYLQRLRLKVWGWVRERIPGLKEKNHDLH